jgi:hypothetical protein
LYLLGGKSERKRLTMDTSPTTLFNNYEQDFQQIIASIRDKVDGNAGGEGVGEFLLSAE